MNLMKKTKAELIEKILNLEESLKVSDKQLDESIKQMEKKDRILSIIAGKDEPKILVQKARLYDMTVNEKKIRDTLEKQIDEIKFSDRVLRSNHV